MAQWETCKCSDGSTYQSTNCAVTDACMCDGNCDDDAMVRTRTGENRPIRVISARPQRRKRSRIVYTDIKHINRNIYKL